MEPVRVLLIADDPLARAGLAALLRSQPDCHIVAQMGSGELTAVSLTTDFAPTPQLIIWDVGWSSLDNLPEWEDSPLPVVALLANPTDTPSVWATGVRAILPRSSDGPKLLAAAQAARHGLWVLDPTLTPTWLPAAGGWETAVPADDLTPRERDVLQLLAEGLTNKGIAQRLQISDHTVKFHVNAILTKLNAQSRTDAVVRATRLGLLLL